MASRAHADEASTGSRFVEELGVKWAPILDPSMSEPISAREAAAAWRRTLADRAVPAVERLAALDGLVALGVDPRRWWFQRGGRTPAARSTSTSEPRTRSSTSWTTANSSSSSVRARLGRPVGYHAWVGSLVHRIIEDCEKGEVERTPEALAAEVDARWRAGVPCDRGVRGVAHTGQGADAAQLVRAVRRPSGIRHRARVRVRLRRRHDRRLHRPDRTDPPGSPA